MQYPRYALPISNVLLIGKCTWIELNFRFQRKGEHFSFPFHALFFQQAAMRKRVTNFSKI